MKRIVFLPVCALLVAGSIMSSCDEKKAVEPKTDSQTDALQVSTDASSDLVLKTKKDTLSYALGAYYYDWSALPSYIGLPQRGLFSDTTKLYSQYVYKINNAQGKKKDELKKEMRQKLDSVINQNKKYSEEFGKGVRDAMNSVEAQNAYNHGVLVGLSMRNNILAEYMRELFGSPKDMNLIDKDIFLAGLAARIKNEQLAVDSFRVISERASHEMYE